MSQKKEEIFSMTAHHCKGLERGLFHIVIPATAGTYGQSIANVVNVLVIKFDPKLNIVGFTCNGGANLENFPELTWKYCKKYRIICNLQAHISYEFPCTCP